MSLRQALPFAALVTCVVAQDAALSPLRAEEKQPDTGTAVETPQQRAEATEAVLAATGKRGLRLFARLIRYEPSEDADAQAPKAIEAMIHTRPTATVRQLLELNAVIEKAGGTIREIVFDTGIINVQAQDVGGLIDAVNPHDAVLFVHDER